MIAITIDEGACVSCGLCADICPTDVFSFDETAQLPRVEQAAECFGCLSCSEICPPHCIAHSDVTLAESHYHDPYALHLASRLGADISGRLNIPTDTASRQHALADLGVRLLSVAEVFKRTLGGSLPAVGTMAGRTLAGHLPRYRAPRSLGEALEMAMLQFAPAWEMDTALDDAGTLTISVGSCFVRDVCVREKLELGGELCILFYNYLAGYLGKMGSARLRLRNAERGPERCVYHVIVYAEASQTA